jgi:hypothetical protein
MSGERNTAVIRAAWLISDVGQSMTRILVICWVGVLLVSGCAFRSVIAEQLLGKYVAALPDGGVEYLELLPGGVCLQEIRLASGATYSTQGKWRYIQDVKCVYIDATRHAVTIYGEMNPKVADVVVDVTRAPTVSRSVTGRIRLGSSRGFHFDKTR